MTPPSTFALTESLQDVVYRPRVTEGPAVGSRALALVLSLPMYGALGTLVFLLSQPSAEAPVLRQSQSVVLQETDFAPPPPPPSAGGAHSGAAAPSPQPPDLPVETPPPLPTELPPVASVPTPTPGPLQTGGQPGGQAGGVVSGQVGGVQGGLQGGVVGGTPDSTLLPPRFDAAYLQNPEPTYPPQSKRMGEEGRVTLRVLVSLEGRAETLEIKTSSGHPRLDQAALDTVRHWRFLPAKQGATPVAAWVLVPITFHIDD